MKNVERLSVKKMVVPLTMMLAFWLLGFWAWRSSGEILALYHFAYIGTAVGLGMGLYTALPRDKKPIGRRITLFLVGGYMLVFQGALGLQNIQIEGVFWELLGGVVLAALGHYFVAKIFGPLLFGRSWCGWACWMVMVLDLLPFKKSPGRAAGKWGHLRYVHFALSFALVAGLWFGFGYRLKEGPAALYWLLTGNALYYSSALVLAFSLRDNRAFCKYLCPITVFLKTGSRFSLLKIRGDKEKCTGCGTCAKACLMDVSIPEYTKAGKRVLSTECSLCQTCLNSCPQRALKLSFGIDVGFKELLRKRDLPPASARSGRAQGPEILRQA